MNQCHEDENYGSIFYETLQNAQAKSALPAFFKYAEIQKIKDSSRDDLINIFNENRYLAMNVKRIKQFSPQNFGFYFIGITEAGFPPYAMPLIVT